MKKLAIFMIVLCGAFSVLGQTAKKAQSLPPNIVNWNGADSDKILKNTIIKTRLKKLMGKKNYADFVESWETVNPITKKGNFLFSSGCLIHACGHIESAIAIDLVNKTIHVGIFRETEKTKFFNERKRKTPKAMAMWSKRLLSNL